MGQTVMLGVHPGRKGGICPGFRLLRLHVAVDCVLVTLVATLPMRVIPRGYDKCPGRSVADEQANKNRNARLLILENNGNSARRVNLLFIGSVAEAGLPQESR